MNWKTLGAFGIKPLRGRTQSEFFDHDEPADESLVHIEKIRELQSLRAIAAEVEYLNLKAQVDHLQNELKQLRITTMHELDKILRNKNQARQDLMLKQQKTSVLHNWHESDRQFNQEANKHANRLSDYRQVVQQTKDALSIAANNNLHTKRRLLKLDEALICRD